MAQRIENYCNDCADGCHYCGLNKDVLIYSCDKCGEDIDTPYDYDDMELCLHCLNNIIRSEQNER